MKKLEEIIQVIEESKSVWEASEKLGLSRQAIHHRLKRNNLKVVRKLKVIKRLEVVKDDGKL